MLVVGVVADAWMAKKQSDKIMALGRNRNRGIGFCFIRLNSNFLSAVGIVIRIIRSFPMGVGKTNISRKIIEYKQIDGY